jgi:beta-galactosidase GanA
MNTHRLLGAALVIAVASLQWGCSQELNVTSIPKLNTSGPVTQLHVDNKPFLALGGELGNSTASDLSTLEAALAKCQRMNVNTVMLPVYWDLIEREEGAYDFALVRGAIDRARAHRLHLVYLWFGTWKNSMSCYAPSWVKRDTARFPRARRSSGEALEIVTPQSAAACEADARAFAALMRWTREYDAAHGTVIMAQVENEVGMIPEACDHSPESDAVYNSPVPAELLSRAAQGALGPEVTVAWEKAGRHTEGNWSQVFGAEPSGEEIFTAWQFSKYVEHVAAAGKHEYPLPMFTNAALIRPGYAPGQYPSAGPLPHLMEVWRCGAPSLDMICPDIYFPNFSEWCRRYVRSGNPLFIPEMAASARAAANSVYAAAQFGAMGFGPFAIESVNSEREREIAECYGLLAGMSGVILESQRNGKIIGLSPQVEFDWKTKDEPQHGQLGGVVFEARFDRPGIGADGSSTATTLPTLGSGRWDALPGTSCGSAMIVQLAPEEFVILGMGVTVTFAPADGKGHVGIDHVQEGHYASDGLWVGGRWLNGDQTHQGRHIQFHAGGWTVQRIRLYRYD